MTLEHIVNLIKSAEAPGGVKTKIVAVDGGGGAGKTTFARKLAAALGDVPVFQTDDFASWDNPLDWWPRLIEEALKPLAAGKRARFKLSEWTPGAERGWGEVSPSPTVILEGVASSRRAFWPYLAYRIWIETPRDERFRRGIARDGEHKRSDWISWQNEEDKYIHDERPDKTADLVLKGTNQ